MTVARHKRTRKPASHSREHFRSAVGGRSASSIQCHVSAGSSRGRPTRLLLLEQFRIRAERAHQIQRERKRKPRVPRSGVPFATRVCDRHRSQGGLQRRARRRVRMAMAIQLVLQIQIANSNHVANTLRTNFLEI